MYILYLQCACRVLTSLTKFTIKGSFQRKFIDASKKYICVRGTRTWCAPPCENICVELCVWEHCSIQHCSISYDYDDDDDDDDGDDKDDNDETVCTVVCYSG